MTICYQLPNSLPSDRLEMLLSFKRIAEEQGVQFLLVGATVRQLILVGHYKIPERRKTQDLDFGVMLPDWESYERLAQALQTSGGFRRDDKHPPHEFRYGAHNWIDLVPFGSIAQDNTIAWPPERTSIMNVIGYDDVFEASVEIDFGGGISIRSVSLQGYVLLKLFAWNDRPAERTKDLQDIWLMLENYYLVGEVEDRLHTEHPDLLTLPAEKYCDLAGARILGRDLARLCRPSTHKALKELLERERVDEQSRILVVFEKEADARGISEPYEHVNACWQEFVKGCLEAAPQNRVAAKATLDEGSSPLRKN